MVEPSAVLAGAEDQVVDEAVAVLARTAATGRRPSGPDQHRRNMRQLFGLVLRCVHEGRAEPIVRPAEQIAAYGFAAGIELGELQGEFNVLAQVLWRHVAGSVPDQQRLEVLELVNAAMGAAKDALARTYVALASQGGGLPDERPRGGLPDARAPGGTERPRGGLPDA
ncbi:MAG: hypothetical protein JO132_14900, partial [Streptosporangiaceae bacterium]|nr:hypothetical protein [Streptosporangiaceae bacterium]